MILGFTAKIVFSPKSTNFGTQKIDGWLLKTYGMISIGFLIQDSFKRVWYFKKTFLLADTNMKMVLKMPFLSLSNANF